MKKRLWREIENNPRMEWLTGLYSTTGVHPVYTDKETRAILRFQHKRLSDRLDTINEVLAK